jgi:hypothetical protein
MVWQDWHLLLEKIVFPSGFAACALASLGVSKNEHDTTAANDTYLRITNLREIVKREKVFNYLV